MNDDRQSGGARGGDVVAEAPLLRLTWAQIVVVWCGWVPTEQ
jgi:hypothetical protein